MFKNVTQTTIKTAQELKGHAVIVRKAMLHQRTPKDAEVVRACALKIHAIHLDIAVAARYVARIVRKIIVNAPTKTLYLHAQKAAEVTKECDHVVPVRKTVLLVATSVAEAMIRTKLNQIAEAMDKVSNKEAPNEVVPLGYRVAIQVSVETAHSKCAKAAMVQTLDQV